VELLARMTAAHGDRLDRRGLAGILFLRADWERAHGLPAVGENLQAEAIQILDALANAGDEEAGSMLVHAGDVCSAAVLELARGASLQEG
jgi:hypothetical protein